MRIEMLLVSCVKCPFSLSDFNQNLNMLADFIEKLVNAKFSKNQLSGSRVVTYGQTDRPIQRS
jgi:hypothetical protein